MSASCLKQPLVLNIQLVTVNKTTISTEYTTSHREQSIT